MYYTDHELSDHELSDLECDLDILGLNSNDSSYVTNCDKVDNLLLKTS